MGYGNVGELDGNQLQCYSCWGLGSEMGVCILPIPYFSVKKRRERCRREGGLRVFADDEGNRYPTNTSCTFQCDY